MVTAATSFAWEIREYQERTSETSAKVTVQYGWSGPVARSLLIWGHNRSVGLLLVSVLRCQLISDTSTRERALNTRLGMPTITASDASAMILSVLLLHQV